MHTSALHCTAPPPPPGVSVQDLSTAVAMDQALLNLAGRAAINEAEFRAASSGTAMTEARTPGEGDSHDPICD